jgi:hypothetical protein
MQQQNQDQNKDNQTSQPQKQATTLKKGTYQSKQGQQPPIQAKSLTGQPLQPIQSKQGQKPPIQAKHQVVQRKAQQAENSTNAVQMKQSNAQGGAIQGGVKTHWGTFEPVEYKLTENIAAGGVETPEKDKRRGMVMKLKFFPNEHVDATKIGIIQTCIAKKQEIPQIEQEKFDFINKGYPILGERAIKEGSGEGTFLDRNDKSLSPVMRNGFGMALNKTNMSNLSPGQYRRHKESGKDSQDDPRINYELGYHYYKDGKVHSQPAYMVDPPNLKYADKNSSQIFETTALALSGAQQGTYYGSIKWGWETDKEGNHKLIPIEVISMGVPTATFMKAAKLWNDATIPRWQGERSKTVDLPIVQVKLITSPINLTIGEGKQLKLPAQTRVQVIDGQSKVKVVDGEHTGIEGIVKESDWVKIKNEVYK